MKTIGSHSRSTVWIFRSFKIIYLVTLSLKSIRRSVRKILNRIFFFYACSTM